MATLYVENVPDELYEALRARAKARRRSISAEVLALLEENIPTPQQLKARQELLNRLVQMPNKPDESGRVFPTTEEMIREDRER
jgi:plasmid stability protein